MDVKIPIRMKVFSFVPEPLSGWFGLLVNRLAWQVVVVDKFGEHRYGCQTGKEVEELCLSLMSGWGY